MFGDSKFHDFVVEIFSKACFAWFVELERRKSFVTDFASCICWRMKKFGGVKLELLEMGG